MFGDFLTGLWIVWGCITTVLVGLLIYRSLIGMKEDDQLFLDPAEAQLEAEQGMIRTRLERLSLYTKGVGFASLLLLILIAGIWVYRGIEGIAHPTLEP